MEKLRQANGYCESEITTGWIFLMISKTWNSVHLLRNTRNVFFLLFGVGSVSPEELGGSRKRKITWHGVELAWGLECDYGDQQ